MRTGGHPTGGEAVEGPADFASPGSRLPAPSLPSLNLDAVCTPYSDAPVGPRELPYRGRIHLDPTASRPLLRCGDSTNLDRHRVS